MMSAAASPDRDLLEHVLDLTPAEAAKTLKRSRQALYSGLSGKKQAYFRPGELAQLYLEAARKTGVERETFLRSVESLRGAEVAREVREALKPRFEERFTSIAIVLPDYPHMRSSNVAARDTLIDLIRERDPRKAAAYLPSREDASLFVSDIKNAGFDPLRVRLRAGTAIAAIPPLVILDPDRKARVYSVSKGVFRPNDYFGGMRLGQLLEEMSEQVEVADAAEGRVEPTMRVYA
jgi:hypothetical protein